MPGSESDSQLVDFLHAVQPRLSRLALMLAGDRAGAEDLVQETMVRLVRRWSTVREAANPAAYACQIAINQWRDDGRRRARSLEVLTSEVPVEATDLDDQTVLDRLTMRDALRELTAKQRAVLYLRYYEDLPVAEVAELLGCSAGTVKSQTSYSLRVLSKSGALAPLNRRS